MSDNERRGMVTLAIHDDGTIQKIETVKPEIDLTELRNGNEIEFKKLLNGLGTITVQVWYDMVKEELAAREKRKHEFLTKGGT